MTIDGTLDLSGASDVLNFAANPYLLRPNIGLAQDFGSLPLVVAPDGGTLAITGSYETLTDGVLNDLIGWSEYTGAFTAAADLPVNTYYFEQSADSIFFHYKVEGSVPEPGTMGLLVLGLCVVQYVRRIKSTPFAGTTDGLEVNDELQNTGLVSSSVYN